MVWVSSSSTNCAAGDHSLHLDVEVEPVARTKVVGDQESAFEQVIP